MNVLFVCSGNTCRSPFAAALLRHRVSCCVTVPASANGLDVGIKSAGTNASGGHPLAYPMEVILQEKGIDYTHQSQRLTWDLVDWADVALTMTRPHKALLAAQIPQFRAKLFTLNEYVGQPSQPDIADPYGTDLESYRQCAAEIETACDRLLVILQALPSELWNPPSGH